MSNIFIANSKFNLEKLKENKTFLLNLISQLREAYIIGYYREKDSGDTTEIEIGSRDSEYDTYTFSVSGKGIISFESPSLRMTTALVERLAKKYPNSRTQLHPNHSWISLEIHNITESNIKNIIKDIVVALETAGHAPAFTLRR